MNTHWSNFVFYPGMLLVLLFALWSGYVFLALSLVLVLDSLSIGRVNKWLRKNCSPIVFQSIFFSYLLVLPLFFAVFTRTFLIDFFYVPSSSMEHSLFPGEYVLINKVGYGAKVPLQWQAWPIIGNFMGSYHNKKPACKSLPALSIYERGDIIVFNNPFGEAPFLIKRIIGLPGDTVRIINGSVLINGHPIEEHPDCTYDYQYTAPPKRKEVISLSNAQYAALSPAEQKKLNKVIEQGETSEQFIFPSAKQEQWNIDQYGPVLVPAKGLRLSSVELQQPAFLETIENHEKHFSNPPSPNNSSNINYTIQQNYYFVLGDNRRHSTDSRNLGFVPENHVQGKMVGVVSKKRGVRWSKNKG